MKKIIAIILIVVISLFTVVFADPAPGEDQTFSTKPPVEVVVEVPVSE